MWWGPAARGASVACVIIAGLSFATRPSLADAQGAVPAAGQGAVPAVRQSAVPAAGQGAVPAAGQPVPATVAPTPIPPAVTPPQPVVEPAEAAFRSGVEAFDAGDYEAALARFRASYRLRATPLVLYNIAVAERLTGQTALACRDLQRYLRDAVDLPSERRLAIERELAQLRRQVGELEIRVAPGGASIVVDGRELATSPMIESVFLHPGEHDVAVSRAGFTTQRRTLQLRAGERETVTLRLRPAAELPPTPIASTSSSERTPRSAGVLSSPWLWTAVGIVLVGAGVTVAALATSSNEPDETRVTLTSPFALSLDTGMQR